MVRGSPVVVPAAPLPVAVMSLAILPKLLAVIGVDTGALRFTRFSVLKTSARSSSE